MLTYLNWAGLAPLTWRAYLNSLWAPELLGNTQLLKWFDRVEALKASVATWLGCQPHQVAFVPSTSAGLIIASRSIPWQPGDVVLYPAHDFPANVMPWQQLERFGVRAIGVKQVSGDRCQVSDEQVSGEQVSGDRCQVSGEQVSDEQVSGEQVSGDRCQVSGEQVSDEQVSGDRCQVSGEQVSGDRCQVSDANPETWNLAPETSPLPRLISISTVDFTTGIEQPWQDVVKTAHQQGIWTCVDAIQSAGVKPSWCPEIDFWCAGTQKWLGSGLGLAVLVLSQRVLDQLSPPMPTWLGLNQPPKLDSGLSKTARSWELGWATPQAIARFETNLRQFQNMGWDVASQAVKARRDYLHERLLEMGYRVVSCPVRWSGILSIDPGMGKAEAIVQSGYKRWIITAQRGDYVRLSPHLFNSWRELAKAVDWLWWCKLNSHV